MRILAGRLTSPTGQSCALRDAWQTGKTVVLCTYEV